MIYTMFRQTRPVIYLVLIGFLTVFYWVGRWIGPGMPWDTPNILRAIGAFMLLVLSVFLMGWMANENKISEFQSMPMLFYVWCLVLFPDVLDSPNTLGAQFILMFSAYKLLGLKDNRRSVYVFFDAGLLVALASWFDPWALIFIVPVLISVFMHNRRQSRDWLALIGGIVSMAMIFMSLGILQGDAWALFDPYRSWTEGIWRFPGGDYPIDHYLAWAFMVLVMGVGIFHIIRIGHQTSGRISPVRLLASFLLSTLLLMLMNYTGAVVQVQYAFFAAAFFISRSVEAINKEKTREIFLLLVLALPFIKLILEYII